MKRRNFITGIVAAIGATMVPNIASAATNKKDVLKAKITYETALFKRFFLVANGFLPSELQMKMFEQYKSQKSKTMISGRQTGMTTFMLTLALFEKKCNAVSVLIVPQTYGMRNRCKERLEVMDYNAGKSVLDGIIDIQRSDRVRVQNGKTFTYDHNFIMVDGHFFEDINLFPNGNARSNYYFGTI